jgi:lysine 6-dehydrogenase
MGRVAVRDLCESESVSEVCLGDFNAALLKDLEAQLGFAKLTSALVDVQDVEEVSRLLSGQDAVINCSPYAFNLKVMEAALQSSCHYLDLGGLFHMTRRQLELNEDFKNRKLLAVCGMGAAPGLTNVMAAAAAAGLETLEAIDIYAASLDFTESSHPFLPPYALDTILDEYTLNPYDFEDGQFKEVAPLSGLQELDFPEPVGRLSTFLTLHSELATLPSTFLSRGIKRVTYRLGLPPAFHEKCKFLVELGLAGRGPLMIQGVPVSPRKVLAALIAGQEPPAVQPDDCEIIRVDVSGTEGGRRRLIRMQTVVRSQSRWQVSAGAFDTGVPPSIVAQLICRGEIEARGVCPPETCVPVPRFFAELAGRGIVIEMRSRD